MTSLLHELDRPAVRTILSRWRAGATLDTTEKQLAKLHYTPSQIMEMIAYDILKERGIQFSPEALTR